MNHIFIGLLLIFLDFNLNLNENIIGLIPDFIGYYFLVNGLAELSGAALSFAKIRPWAIGMGIYSAVLYVMDLLAISATLGWFGVILGIAGTAISLYIAYEIIEGVKELEVMHSTNLNSENLKMTWKFLAVFNIAAYIGLAIPVFGIICIIVSFIANIVFFAAFNTTKKLYEVISQ